jgi:hypothetical protein
LRRCMMNHLPNELYRQSIAFRDLCSLTRVSRAVQVEAERVIYRRLNAKNLKEVVIISKRIRASPRLATYVETFTVTSWLNPAQADLLQPFYTLLSSLARIITQLRHLSIFFYGKTFGDGSDADICSRVFRSSSFKLISFESNVFLNKNLIRVLETQPTVRRLQITPRSEVQRRIPEGALPSHVLPNLNILTSYGDEDELGLQLLPGRPMTHAKISFSHMASLHNLALSKGPLRFLEFRSHIMLGVDWAEGLRALPALVLELEMLGGIRIHPGVRSNLLPQSLRLYLPERFQDGRRICLNALQSQQITPNRDPWWVRYSVQLGYSIPCGMSVTQPRS